MSDAFRGSELKVARAKAHIDDFAKEVTDYFSSEPHEAEWSIDESTEEAVLIATIIRDPPDKLPLLVGDALHNLRSALDQMVCSFVRGSGHQVPGGTSFPIAGSEKRFEEACVGRLRAVPPAAQRYIKSLKPFAGGNDLLWSLNELSNRDKHNDIVPVWCGRLEGVAHHTMPGMFVSPTGELCLLGGPPGSTPLVVGTSRLHTKDLTERRVEVFRSKAAARGIPVFLEMYSEFRFGGPAPVSGRPVFETLTDMLSQVERIVDGAKRID